MDKDVWRREMRVDLLKRSQSIKIILFHVNAPQCNLAKMGNRWPILCILASLFPGYLVTCKTSLRAEKLWWHSWKPCICQKLRVTVAKAELPTTECPTIEVKNKDGSLIWHCYSGKLSSGSRLHEALWIKEITFTEIGTHYGYGFAICWSWPLECLI